MPDEELRIILNDITKRLTRIETAISGYDGQDGLMRKLEEVSACYKKLNQSFWILVGILIGSGILGGSIVAAMR